MSPTSSPPHLPSRIIILGTSIALGAGSVVMIFAPDEVASALGGSGTPILVLVLQVYGAALFGLAMTGWMVKDSIVGGVFGQSYVVGNAAHAFVGAFALLRPALAASAAPGLRLGAAVYAVLAVVFGSLMFVASPGSKQPARL